MSKVKDFILKNKILVMVVAALAVIVVAGSIYFVVTKTNPHAEDNVVEQEVKVEDIGILEDNGLITGIQDMKVVKGTEIDLKDLVSFNDDYVKSIDVDDSQVDYNKDGEYEVIYTITFDKEKLQTFVKDENIEVPFDTEKDSIIIKVSTVVTVTDNEEEAEVGDETTTNDTTDKTSEENQSETNNNSSSNSNSNTNNSSSGNSNSNSSSSSKPSHEHVWVSHTETVQEPVTVIVDTETKEYTLYRIYWYNTKTWEETRDPNRFNEWTHSADGQLYPLYNPYDRPEDNPLFQGYDSNGNATYLNDHSIISGLYEEVPCEPYEKTEMRTVTITVETCSICGATK